jgi:hypothetical protein
MTEAVSATREPVAVCVGADTARWRCVRGRGAPAVLRDGAHRKP